jgi:protein-tyrosine phosphatase
MNGEYDEIIPGLYQGSIPTFDQNGFYDPFDVVVFCVDPRFSTWLHSFSPKNKEIRHFHFDDLNDMSVALDKAQEIAEFIKDGKKVIVVCASGMNRSGAFCVLVLNQYGWSLEKAAAKILEGRAHALPNGVHYLVRMVKYHNVNNP